ncbi:MAG: SRPBCC family protein [Deltaproteobacteria bacterium]|nr:SRPBCC family protein [Deltaproteobacteria bacterium]MBI2501308.1 SRPBCC family protein [Deltaproteobacteria bacterium]MBI4196584.1 SRPBCC family protein [Deltaproteobacteria bacterium]
MTQASETIFIEAPAKTVYDIIMDFEKYPDFLPDVKEASLLSKKGNSLEVEFEIQVIKKINYSLKVSGTPGKKVAWSLLKGDFFKKNDGGWSLKEKNGKTEATYSVDIDFGIFVPSMITSKLIGSNLPGMLRRFKERIENGCA